MSKIESLENLIAEFNEVHQENLFALEQPFRDFVLAKFTPEAPKISLFFSLYAVDENSFGIRANLNLENYETGDQINFNDIEILNPEGVEEQYKMDTFFERIQDAITDDFIHVARTGFKGLELPQILADAFLQNENSKYEYVGATVYWNEQQYLF